MLLTAASLTLSLCGCQKKEPDNVWNTYRRTLTKEELENPNTRFQHYTYTIPSDFEISIEESTIKNVYKKIDVSMDGAFYSEQFSFMEEELINHTAEDAIAHYETQIYEKYQNVEKEPCKIGDREWYRYVMENMEKDGIKYHCIIYLWAEDNKDILSVEYYGISDQNIAGEIMGESDDSKNRNHKTTAINLEDYNVMYWDATTEEVLEEATEEAYLVTNSITIKDAIRITETFVSSIREK